MRGTNLESLSLDLRAGIEQHREIDAFTDLHPLFLRSRNRLPASLRHWRGVLIDIYYDHFLARTWDTFDDRPLSEFSAQVYTALRASHDELPPALQGFAPRMIEHNWLAGYTAFEDLERLFRGMGKRVRRAHPFADACNILREHHEPLAADFAAFYPCLLRFVADAARQ